MRAEVVWSPIGVFAFDGDGNLLHFVPFPRDARLAAQRLVRLMEGMSTEELGKLIDELRQRGFSQIAFESSRLAMAVHREFGVETVAEAPLKAGELIRERLEALALEVGFARSVEELHEWVREVSMEAARIRIKRASEKRDLVVAQAIQAIDDLDKTLNLFASRIREWYGLHFPELNRLVESHETYLRLVSKLGRRENFTVEALEEVGIPRKKAEEIAKSASTSVGAELSDEDIEEVRMLSQRAIELYKARKTLENYVDEVMGEVAPNIKALVGPLLGARLISLAGGLESLAKMPSSTIQVLGAEKALFRALRTGAKPPKHGIIFQHPHVHGSKRWQRGKIARALAGKLAIAARLDAYSGSYRGDELRESVERRVEEIREKYKAPPKRKPRPRRRRVGRKG